MSFATKTDYLGLATTGLEIKGNGQNASNGVLQIPGSDGSILGDEVYGHIKAPNCDYCITQTITLSTLKLGKCFNSDNHYALQSVKISTSAGGEPTFSATGVQIESSATRTVCVYDVDSLTLSPARHALTFGAFTFTESSSLSLQSSDFEATCTIDPSTINGTPVASDSTAGIETVTATFWSSSETTSPTVTLDSAWHITSDWNCTGADSSMFVWTVTLTKYLTASQVSQE